MRHLLCIALFLCCAAMPGEESPKTEIKPYPLTQCLMMDDSVDRKIPAEVYKGQEFLFCCKGCIRKFKKDPEKYLTLLNAKVAEKTGAAH